MTDDATDDVIMTIEDHPALVALKSSLSSSGDGLRGVVG